MFPSSLPCICLFSLVFLSAAPTNWAYPDFIATEGRMKGSSIFLDQIESTNLDITSYKLTGEGEEKFEVDNEGRVFQVAELDREKKNKYILMASALNSSGIQVEKDQEIIIVVRDINDNVPIFIDETLSGTVREGAPLGFVFMTVSATDADDAYNTSNANVVYEMDPGSDSPSSYSGSRFAVNKTGQISVVGNLDYESDPVVYFVVHAKDGDGIGKGLNTATASVTVTLIDSNDHAPVFDGSTLPAVKNLSESSGLNTPLYNIYADDKDAGKNKKVYFDIVSGNVGGPFTIVSTPSASGKSLGELQLAKPLDYGNGTTEYTLTVCAYNKESNNSADIKYQETTTLTIKVTDANEAPVFTNTPYTGIVLEDDYNSTVALPITVKISAKDYDFGGNQTVTLSLNDSEGWFNINSRNGEISNVAKVDREAPAVTNGVYIMAVVATDNYDHGENASSTANISITIQDINDNPPSAWWGGVQICEEPVNDTVKIIVASDPDSAANGPPFTFRLDSDSVDTGKWGIRRVDAVSSEIISKFDDYELSGETDEVIIPFTITDSGSPPQTGTATLTVTICKCDDNGETTCNDAPAFPIVIVIVIAVIVIVVIAVIAFLSIFVFVPYKQRQASLIEVNQKAGGEEHQDARELNVLREPLMENSDNPVRIETPLQPPPKTTSGSHMPDDIGEVKDQPLAV